MEIAIVDDEELIREQVCSLIKSQRPNCWMEIYTTGEELLAARHKFDLIFLDIQMEGMNGIEAARMYRKQQEDTVLVFITRNREYVFEAFEVSPFYYLPKPIEETKFLEIFDRAAREALKRNHWGQETLLIRTKSRSFTVHRNDIRYIENRGKKVEIYTVEDEGPIEIYATMAELTRKLGEGFYRCHRGYLVNMAYIAEFDSDSISLAGGAKVYLSKKKHGEFVKIYMDFLQKEGGTVI